MATWSRTETISAALQYTKGFAKKKPTFGDYCQPAPRAAGQQPVPAVDRRVTPMGQPFGFWDAVLSPYAGW